MSLRPALLAAAVSSAALLACAKLLSYDDYSARPEPLDSGIFATDSSAEAAVDAAPPIAHPPLRPAGERMPSGKGKTLWLAVKRYHFGELDRDGNYAKDAFRYWGFDLDSVCTSSKDSTDNVGTCKRNAKAVPTALTDGDDCRDNNFGQFVVPIIHTYSPDFEKTLDDGVYAGTVTWVLRIDDLDDGPDDAYAPGKLYRTTDEKGIITPKWDGTDVRKVLSDSVVGGDLNTSVNEFASGYVKDHVWVAGDPQAQNLVMPVSEDISVKLSLQGMLMTAQLDDAHTTGKDGTVGGGIPFASFQDFLTPLLIKGNICPDSPLYQGFLDNASHGVDLVTGAPNLQDTTKDCDMLSIGIGLTFAAIQPVTAIADPSPSPPSKCADAGTD